MNRKEVIEVSVRSAEQFVELYYRVYDSQRAILHRFYKDTSKIVWNGNPLQGQSAVAELVQRLPITQHKYEIVNCHPIIAGDSAATSLLVTANGNVVYGTDASGREFSQTFVLKPDTEKVGTWFVAEDCFRLV